MATPTYDPIASTTLASPASSVTFSSLDTIAAGYRDLILVVDYISTGSQTQERVILNGDTGSNYNYIYMRGDGSSANSAAFSSTSMFLGGGVYGASDTRRQIGVQFLDFSATDKHKSVLVRSDKASGSWAGTEAMAHRWANTAAITSIQINANINNFAAGSVFSIYGIAA